MYGRKVKLRFLFVTLILITLILTVFLVLKSLEENVVYFQSPTEIKTLSELDKNKIRVGGMVKKNSINVNSDEVKFIITDFKNEINVTYSGAIPNLFSEGKRCNVQDFFCIASATQLRSLTCTKFHKHKHKTHRGKGTPL